jgi:sulfotransferase family protein
MITTNDIIAAAQQQVGAPVPVDEAVLPGLNTFIDALNTEAPLTERGWQSIHRILVNTLANRLRVDDYLAQHPALLQQAIEKPLFVFGLPRTGTTLTINLLHADPDRRSLLRWEALNSVPPPKAGELSSDPRCLKEQAAIDLSLQHAPHIAGIHYEAADSPTECQFVMSQSFCTQYFEAIVEAPSYREWFMNSSYLPAFTYHKRLLQLLQAQAPGRWTLKNPWHALFLDDLTTIYPDAQLVMTHRNPVDVVASACSLISNVRAMFSDQVDKRSIGESLMDTFEEMISRTLAYKKKYGWDSIYDLQYTQLMKDPIGEMKKIYQHFDQPWTEAIESSMLSCLAINSKAKHGEHEYSLEEYGLTADRVRERFAHYYDRFEIPLGA